MIEEILSRCKLDYTNDNGKVSKEDFYLVKWFDNKRKDSWVLGTMLNNNSYVMQVYKTHF